MILKKKLQNKQMHTHFYVEKKIGQIYIEEEKNVSEQKFPLTIFQRISPPYFRCPQHLSTATAILPSKYFNKYKY